MPEDKQQHDCLWVHRRLIVNYDTSSREDLVPELAPLRAEEWTDGWRGCWRAILAEFLPHAQTLWALRYERRVGNRTFDHPRGVIAPSQFQSESAQAWARKLDDSTYPECERKPLWQHGALHYAFLCDVYGWALKACLDYTRCRFKWGDWQEGEGITPAADEFFHNWPRSQRACKWIVRRLEEFAIARRNFHVLYESRIRRPFRSQRKHADKARSILRQKKGRPGKLQISNAPDEDIWLILSWPIARWHHWTYKDVVRALRLKFEKDSRGCPAPFGQPFPQIWTPAWMSRATAQAFVSFSALKRGILEMPEELERRRRQWRAEALRVSAADEKRMRFRCNSPKMLGLKRLKPDRRDECREPPFYVFAATIVSNI